MRPFRDAARVKCCGCSRLLQRVTTDFGADSSFDTAAKKLKEHYGITLPVSACRNITEAHGAKMAAQAELLDKIPTKQGPECIIAEADGSMVPIVEIVVEKDGPTDRRKCRKHEWKEARLTMARPQGSTQAIYGAIMGSPDDVGELLLHCTIKAGLTTKSRVHCVGDGATWIANQVSLVFANQGEYLVDFYHVSDYLAKAAEVCAPDQKDQWLRSQGKNLKEGRIEEVFAGLLPHCSQSDKESAAATCYNYLKNRETQLDYVGAIQAGLPIGSGEIESGHRHVIQARLKIAGAWWKKKNMKSMLALRAVSYTHLTLPTKRIV